MKIEIVINKCSGGEMSFTECCNLRFIGDNHSPIQPDGYCLHCGFHPEIQKLQHQLEIQTKRVENLKKSNEFYAIGGIDYEPRPDKKYLYKEGINHDHDLWRLRSMSDFWTGSMARSCQAIDQELEKQFTNGEDSETPQETHTK